MTFNRKLIINASLPGEIRVATIDKEQLYDFNIEVGGERDIQNNIYLGRIEGIADHLDAAFVNIGQTQKGFLPVRNLAADMLEQNLDMDSPDDEETVKMSQLLNVGDQILVKIKVDKGSHEGKGAVLTNAINLPGYNLVLCPDAETQGIILPNHIPNQAAQQSRELLKKLELPEKMGLVLKKSGLMRPLSELQAELNGLLAQWNEILLKAKTVNAPKLLLTEQSLLLRILNNRLNAGVDQVLIDDEETYRQFKHWARYLRPSEAHKVVLYSGDEPIFIHYGIEAQVQQIYQRKVKLPSGGSIVIDYTEALTSIDINSGQSAAGDMENTALQTNNEALTEIARQLRLRDIGGQIVIDLIQMNETQNKKNVLNSFRQLMEHDQGNVRIGEINEFGLLSMTRKRLRKSVIDRFMEPCPNCKGQGMQMTMQTQISQLFRYLEGTINLSGGEQEVLLFVPIDISIILNNEKRAVISKLEQRHEVDIQIIPAAALSAPDYEIHIRKRESSLTALNKKFKKVELSKAIEALPKINRAVEKPLLKNEPVVIEESSGNAVKRWFRKLLGLSKPTPVLTKDELYPSRKRRDDAQSGGRRGKGKQSGSGRGRQSRTKNTQQGNGRKKEESKSSQRKDGAGKRSTAAAAKNRSSDSREGTEGQRRRRRSNHRRDEKPAVEAAANDKNTGREQDPPKSREAAGESEQKRNDRQPGGSPRGGTRNRAKADGAPTEAPKAAARVDENKTDRPRSQPSRKQPETVAAISTPINGSAAAPGTDKNSQKDQSQQVADSSEIKNTADQPGDSSRIANDPRNRAAE